MSAAETAQAMRALLELDDSRLLAHCEMDTYRASGPGGQKRNKTSSAVRLRLRMGGLAVIAEESRSQHENKARALRRLREAIAVGYRLAAPATIEWPSGVTPHARRLALNAANPALPLALAIVLDALQEAGGRISVASERLDISGSSLQRFLQDHPAAWAASQRIRAAHGLAPLHGA